MLEPCRYRYHPWLCSQTELPSTTLNSLFHLWRKDVSMRVRILWKWVWVCEDLTIHGDVINFFLTSCHQSLYWLVLDHIVFRGKGHDERGQKRFCVSTDFKPMKLLQLRLTAGHRERILDTCETAAAVSSHKNNYYKKSCSYRVRYCTVSSS